MSFITKPLKRLSAIFRRNKRGVASKKKDEFPKGPPPSKPKSLPTNDNQLELPPAARGGSVFDAPEASMGIEQLTHDDQGKAVKVSNLFQVRRNESLT